MRRLLAASLISTSALVAPSALAQDAEVQALRAQVAALQAQVEVLSQRIDQFEAQRPEVETAIPAQQPAASDPAPANDAAAIAFAGAPEFEGEGGWSFKPFGRLQLDAGTISLPDGLAATNGFGSELRRARLGVEGAMPGGFGYKLELDFAGGEVEVSDAIITYKDGGLTLTAGQHNPFQSLEELTSSRFSSFIERAAFTDAFGFERRLGFSAQYTSGIVLAQAGVFSDNLVDLPGKSWSTDGRVVVAPKLGSAQLHLGGSIHWAELEAGSSVRYRQRPFAHFTSVRPIDTGNFTTESELGAGLEAAMIAGPLHLAGETFWQKTDRLGALANATFFGAYAEAGYYLTRGDRRGYKSFKFDRTRPASALDDGGIGAVQVNLRYDYLDLTEAGLAGGIQNGYFASLVWVPTDYTRLMLNYGHLEYDQAAMALPSGDRSYSGDVLAMRAQMDF